MASKEFPLYPDLPEAGKLEAQELIDCFKKKLKKIAEEVISELYTDIIPHIESDSWNNFRNCLMDGFRNYNNRAIQADYDFADIRKTIFEQFRAEIIIDINQDLLKENETLKTRVDELGKRLKESYRHGN